MDYQAELKNWVVRQLRKNAKLSVGDIITENKRYLLTYRRYIVYRDQHKKPLQDLLNCKKSDELPNGFEIIGASQFISLKNRYIYKHKALRRMYNFE